MIVILPLLPPSASSGLNPEPADMAMPPPSEASSLALPEAIWIEPPAAPPSPVAAWIDPGVTQAEVPVRRDILPPSPPSDNRVATETSPASANLEGEVLMCTELLLPLSAVYTKRRKKSFGWTTGEPRHL